MARRQTTGLGLSPSEAFTGLIDYGLFSERMPPCFSSAGLSRHVPPALVPLMTENDNEQLKKLLKNKRHDYIRYDSMRHTNIPRQLGIPHPESYIVQCLALKRHWDKIKRHCAKPTIPVSRIFVRKSAGTRLFRMNYKGLERFEDEEEDLRARSGARYMVRTDISNCFPSIYTHSIPWALHGHGKAKKDRSLLLDGNLLDRVTQDTRDGQTNGLLIGPHASNVLSEIVLTGVDRRMVASYGRYSRHIDDYEYAAGTYEEAESFVRDLGIQLREYDLRINDKKTEIAAMPIPIEEGWVRELNAFDFETGSGAVRFRTVRQFMDLALALAQGEEDYSVLNYAIKMVPSRLSPRAKRLFNQQAANLTVLYPYLASIIDEYVFTRHRCVGAGDVINRFAGALLDKGIQRIYPDAVVHALYFTLKYGLELKGNKLAVEEKLRQVIEIDDCLAQVLAREYAIRHGMKSVRDRVRRRTDKLKDLKRREGDRYWLLIYQVWREGTLRGNGQEFLAQLKGRKFAFLNL